MAKKIIRQLHLWLGLASGIVVFIVTLSGSCLVFEEELEHLFSHRLYFVTPGPERLPVDDLRARAVAADPAISINRMEAIPHDPTRSVIFSGKKEGATWAIAMNPYTGEVIKAMNHENRFFPVMLRLHRYLLMKETGKAITGVSCIIFVFLVISGIVLWWPKRWKYIRQRLTVKWDASFKRVVWDLHAVGGFYINLVIFVIAVTGLVWSYKWVNNSIYVMFDGKPPAKYQAAQNKMVSPAGAGVYEKVYQSTNKILTYKGSITMNFPANDTLSISVTKENYEAKIPNVVDFLYFEQADGSMLKARMYDDESMGMKVRRTIYPIHTGSIFGWPTKILAFISCLIAASLPVTGLMIWMKGDKKKKVVKKKPPVRRKELETV